MYVRVRFALAAGPLVSWRPLPRFLKILNTHLLYSTTKGGKKNNMVFIELFLDETTRSFPATEIFFIFLFGYIIARNILFVHILTQLKLFLFPSLSVSAV
jgi:hypothetical protein